MVKVKCQMCGIRDTDKEEMKVEVVGNKSPQNKYYHVECYGEFLKKKEFDKKEAEELDVLFKTICDLYGVKSLPNGAFVKLQALRNGTSQHSKTKKSKQGYSYLIISKAFEYCSESIEYANNNKNFKGSLMNAVSYGIAVVADKLAYIENREKVTKKKKERMVAVAERAEETTTVDYDQESSYERAKRLNMKKKTDKYDYFD